MYYGLEYQIFRYLISNNSFELYNWSNTEGDLKQSIFITYS